MSSNWGITTLTTAFSLVGISSNDQYDFKFTSDNSSTVSITATITDSNSADISCTQ